MDSSRQSESEKVPSVGGQFEFLQHCSSTTDSTATTETTAGSSSTSVHAIFNLDTGKVMDAIKETREVLEDKKGATQPPMSIHHSGKTKPKGKKQKKKVSASWTAEWSEEHYKKESKVNGKFIRFKPKFKPMKLIVFYAH